MPPPPFDLPFDLQTATSITVLLNPQTSYLEMVFGLFKTPAGNNVETAQEEAPKFERVVWYREPGLRALYWHAFILCVSSASTGYDG